MNTFKSNRGCVLLAVQGGRFSEGEDFPGDEMDVSIVVGLSLPPPSPTMYAEYKQMEANQFDKHQAYMVLSLLPALRKAIQSAGRHVRDPWESRDGLLHGFAIRGEEGNRFDAIMAERGPSQRGVRPDDDFRDYSRVLFERTGSLNWTPLRKAILAAARWSLVAPIAPRLPPEVPDSSTISMEADGSLSRSRRANREEDLGSPPPILTESDE